MKDIRQHNKVALIFNNPDLYPHLLVRVSGYSAYFNDLSLDMKEEIIQRSTQQAALG